MLTLYHGRTSVCSIKARLALAEKGVSFDSRLMALRGDQFDPGYMQLNPNAVVPTIVHDGRVVVEREALEPTEIVERARQFTVQVTCK